MSKTKAMEASQVLENTLRAAGLDEVRLYLVLGSGLGAFAERLSSREELPYSELAGMPGSTIPGHAGQLVIGEMAGRRVAVQQGRVHLYEGRHVSEVTRAVRAFAALGGRSIVVSNAAGSLRPEWAPGTLMRIEDHINLQCVSPLRAEERGFGTPYDPELGAVLDEAARAAGVTLEKGVYAGLTGPSYETPAEIRRLSDLGADAVGMSTVAEALAAHAAGMRVTGISCITNLAAGLGEGVLNHEEVIATGHATSEKFADLLEAALPHLVD